MAFECSYVVECRDAMRCDFANNVGLEYSRQQYERIIHTLLVLILSSKLTAISTGAEVPQAIN